jgi:hypothetical protein
VPLEHAGELGHGSHGLAQATLRDGVHCRHGWCYCPRSDSVVGGRVVPTIYILYPQQGRYIFFFKKNNLK